MSPPEETSAPSETLPDFLKWNPALPAHYPRHRLAKPFGELGPQLKTLVRIDARFGQLLLDHIANEVSKLGNGHSGDGRSHSSSPV